MSILLIFPYPLYINLLIVIDRAKQTRLQKDTWCVFLETHTNSNIVVYIPSSSVLHYEQPRSWAMRKALVCGRRNTSTRKGMIKKLKTKHTTTTVCDRKFESTSEGWLFDPPPLESLYFIFGLTWILWWSIFINHYGFWLSTTETFTLDKTNLGTDWTR